MNAKKSDRRHAFMALGAVFLSFSAVPWMLWRFPPDCYGFYPICPVREYLHLECPGCGATRAIAALLQGHVAEAFSLNGLLVGIVLPLAAIYAGLCVTAFLRKADFRWPMVPRTMTAALFVLTAVFTLARNL